MKTFITLLLSFLLFSCEKESYNTSYSITRVDCNYNYNEEYSSTVVVYTPIEVEMQLESSATLFVVFDSYDKEVLLEKGCYKISSKEAKFIVIKDSKLKLNR